MVAYILCAAAVTPELDYAWECEAEHRRQPEVPHVEQELTLKEAAEILKSFMTQQQLARLHEPSKISGLCKPAVSAKGQPVHAPLSIVVISSVGKGMWPGN